MPSVTATVAATTAAQHLGVLDSGESLSTQQITDFTAVANNLLESWYQEQVLSIQTLLGVYLLAGGTYTPAAVPAFSGPSTPLTLPLAYIRSLELNGAIELAGQYGVPIPESVMKQATEARVATMPLTLRVPIPNKTDEPGQQ